MHRFRFRLDSVLGWRRLQVETEEVKLRRLFEQLRQADLARERVQAEKLESGRAVLHSASPSSAELAAMEAHSRHLTRELARLAVEKLRCEQRIAEQRGRLVEAQRAMRLLEKLRDKQLTEWNEAANREQEAAAAELFLGKWNR